MDASSSLVDGRRCQVQVRSRELEELGVLAFASSRLEYPGRVFPEDEEILIGFASFVGSPVKV